MFEAHICIYDITSLKTTFPWCTMYFNCWVFKPFTYILVLFSYVIKLLHVMCMHILFFLNTFSLRSSIFTLIPQCLQQVVFKPRVILYLVASRWTLISSHAKISHEILKQQGGEKIVIQN